MPARDDWPNVADLTTASVVSLGRRDGLNEMFDEIDMLREEVSALLAKLATTDATWGVTDGH